MVATPLGFILSLLGLILNKNRRAALFGVLIAGGMVAFALISSLC